MEPSFFRKIRKAFAALLAAAATGTAIPAYASAFTVTSTTSGQTTTFTVTRSGDTSVAETVAYRAVSRSALAGLHFRETAGRLAFAAGQTSHQVSVEERTAAQIDDPRFTYFQSGGATGASRAYRFEVVDEGGFPVAAADRSIAYDSSLSVSAAAFAANALAVSSGEITVTDGGYAQAYHAVPLSSYFSSAVPQDYLAASGARIQMTLDFQAKELSDGYQYVQILADQTSACDSGAGDGDPGTLRASSYLAGFELWKGNTLAEYATLSFPVTSAGNNCGAVSTPWKDTGHNDLGNLCQQRFAANCRAADGRLSLPASLSTLGVRFDASGSGNDDWVAKSVVARLQAVPAGPSLLASRPVVTPAPVCKGATVAVSLVFGEIVTVSSPSFLALSTSWGELPYAAGSGANVLTFAGPVTAAAGTPLRVTGLSGGTVQGLAGDAFAWPGNLTTDRTVDSLPAPPLEAATGFYLLSTPAHLRWLSERIASYPATSAALADDIDLSAAGSFPAMGGSAGFAGVFDGRGHALAGLSVTSPDSSGASPARYGLFGLVAAQGVVTNLALSGATVSAPGNPALVGAVCGRNLGTIDHCSVSGGQVSTAPRDADGTGTALGGVCGENAGTVRACRAVAPLASGSILLFNRVSNDAVGGIAGVNAASGTLEACYFHAWFEDITHQNITRGAICGSNAGTVRRCGGLHDNRNYFDGAVGSGAGTVEDTSFPATAAFSSGEVCYALNNGVTDGYQPWYQSGIPLGDPLPVFSGSTVYLHGSTYVNRIYHDWVITSDEPSADYSNFVWTVTCSFGETATLSATGTAEVTRQPTCTEPGKTTWTYVPPANDYGITGAAHVDQLGAPPALGHDWGEPEYRWYSSAQGLFCHAFRTCARCDATTNETVAATLVSSLAPTCTAPGTNTCAAAFASPLFAPQTNAFQVAALGHAWGEATYVWAVDHSSVTASNACTRCGETVQETVLTFGQLPTDPTCTEPGTITKVAPFTSSAFTRQEKSVPGEPALGHDWGAPVWNWNADYTAATATFACSRCDEAETVAAAVAHAPGEGDATNCTATAVHHGETFTDTVTILPPVSYIDVDGIERQCYRYTVLVPGQTYYTESGDENWYVVTNDTAVGYLSFLVEHAHLILCDGATLTASHSGTSAIYAGGALTIYGQSGGTGAISASATSYGIRVADHALTVNGGIVEATATNSYGIDSDRTVTINGGVVRGSIHGDYGIVVNGGVVESSMLSTFNSYDIVLGWTNATDSITAAAYSARSVSVRAGQRFWNGEEFVGDGAVDASKLAGRTLTPAYAITCDLGGGSVEGENPAFYARESDDIVLVSPVRTGYDFAGWTGTGLSAPTNLVVIPHGSTGHRAYAATWEPITAVPYIDENGEEQVCTDFICLSSAADTTISAATSGPTNWYVVSGRVAIDGHLRFQGERSCIILRDGATLAVTNATDTVDDAIRAEGRLEIYGQAGGTGAIAARGNLVSNDDDGIQAASLAIYGGNVRAVGAYGIYVTGDLVVGGGTVVARAENGNGILADGLLVRGGAIDSVGKAGAGRGIYVMKDGMTVLGGTVSAACSNLWATGIYVANGDIAVRGGSVVASGNKSAAIYVRNGGFAMSGGAVTATSADAADGIYASGDIVLGWTDLADFILAGSYTSASGAVSVQKGQTFADEGGNLYEGELDSGELAAARGKTLRPYLADTTPYAAWAAASGVSGAWNETDALGIHNVFRYAFDKPTGAFENPTLLGIAFASDGTALVLTPPLVNTAGFDFSLLATDDLAGANPATFPLDPSGTNAVPTSSSSVRFFRLQAAER